MEIEQTVAINALPAKVWAALINVENWPSWTKSVETVKRLDANAFGMGSEAQVKQPKLPAFVWKVVEFEPGAFFAWEVNARGVRSYGGHRISPTDGGCTVTLTIRQNGPMAWLAALLYGGMSRRYVDMEAQGLKRYCEAGEPRLA